MNKADLAKRWFEYSLTDQRIASHLFDTMHPKPLEAICYHSQQAAEKALKGFLVFHDIEPPKSHNLTMLCQLCAEVDISFREYQSGCSRLSLFATTTRYPANTEVEEHDAVFALKEADRVLHKSQEHFLKDAPLKDNKLQRTPMSDIMRDAKEKSDALRQEPRDCSSRSRSETSL